MRDKRMGLIYLIHNIKNDKKYVGMTIRDIETRWQEHQNYALNKQFESLLSRAIRKYGHEAFVISVLEEDIEENQLGEAERRWIAKLDTFNGAGYNMTEGGEGNAMIGFYERTPEILKKLSVSRKKLCKNPTPAMLKERECHSRRMKGERNPFYGKAWGRTGPLKEITKQRLSNAHKGKILSKNHKKNIAAGLAKARSEGRRPKKGKAWCWPIYVYDEQGNWQHVFMNFDEASQFAKMEVKKLRMLAKQNKTVGGLLFIKNETSVSYQKFKQIKKQMEK